MSKKIFCLLLLLIMPVMILCGCGVEDNKTTQLEQEEYSSNEIIDGVTFVCVAKPKSKKGYYIYVHKETKVIYLVYENNHLSNGTNTRYAYGYFGITPLLNADGTPMLWEGEL